MPNTEKETILKNTLEALVDRHGLPQFLVALSKVCFEKGEHLEANWQDSEAAEWWSEQGKMLDEIAVAMWDA